MHSDWSKIHVFSEYKTWKKRVLLFFVRKLYILAARVFYISLVFSNVQSVLSQGIQCPCYKPLNFTILLVLLALKSFLNDQLFKTSRLQFNNRLLGPKQFLGRLRNMYLVRNTGNKGKCSPYYTPQRP